VPTRSIVTADTDATRAFGVALGRRLPIGAVVLLHGDLGAGKTTLTQGIALGLGITEPIQSPTFTLVAEHAGTSAEGQPVRLYHLDLYRLDGEADLDSFGWEHYLAPEDGISVIEWPERAGTWLPEAYLLVTLDPAGPDQRRITIEAVPSNGSMARVLDDETLALAVRDTTALG
jgi:tRNA threonylcarbamoyladenosine biosynthesis protein TsaE